DCKELLHSFCDALVQGRRESLYRFCSSPGVVDALSRNGEKQLIGRMKLAMISTGCSGLSDELNKSTRNFVKYYGERAFPGLDGSVVTIGRLSPLFVCEFTTGPPRLLFTEEIGREAIECGGDLELCGSVLDDAADVQDVDLESSLISGAAALRMPFENFRTN